MAITKSQLPSASGITALLGIAGKTITSIDVYLHGVVDVTDIYCTDTNHYYIKKRCGEVEVGGTTEWGTGTKVSGR